MVIYSFKERDFMVATIYTRRAREIIDDVAWVIRRCMIIKLYADVANAPPNPSMQNIPPQHLVRQGRRDPDDSSHFFKQALSKKDQ